MLPGLAWFKRAIAVLIIARSRWTTVVNAVQQSGESSHPKPQHGAEGKANEDEACNEDTDQGDRGDRVLKERRKRLQRVEQDTQNHTRDKDWVLRDSIPEVLHELEGKRRAVRDSD